MDLFNNKFIQALGVGLFFYLVLKLLGSGLYSIVRILESFSRWYRYSAIPHAEEAAIAIAVLFLLISAVMSGQRR